MNDFQEYFDMLMVLGEYCKHYRNAQDLYAARYPDMQQKSHMDFKRLADFLQNILPQLMLFTIWFPVQFPIWFPT